MDHMRKRALAFLTAFLMGVTTFGSSIPFHVQAAEPVEVQELESEDLLLRQDGKSGDVFYNAGGTMTDFRDETIYFLMTSRFYDGDSSNNVQCWDGQQNNPGDPPWRGDFKGLIEKLDYIKALGFTAIWITPVVENCSGYDYHGYHAINFSKVDPRYESKDCTYQDLIDAAHEKGIKIVQDVVFNHTGNWGEENLYKIAEKNYSADLSDAEASMVPTGLPAGYESMKPQQQYETRVDVLTNAASDKNNIYHHNNFIKSWETYDEQVTHIAGDCLDLNTENPAVYHYLVQAYSSYIKMGVDAFRVDTVKHINRLVYNNALVEPLNQAYNETHGTTGANNFYMFGEVCTRVRGVWNRDIPAISCPFYTWKETETYAWDDSETEAAIATNQASVKQAYEAHTSLGNEPTSDNAFLDGNDYHTPDYSKSSGLSVIDFPMHWNFNSARDAFSVAVGGDQYYNDATFNVTYVDSHDYAPDGAPENQRFAGSQAQWAENLSLMFTFRGIPCIYYGSEIEFKKGEMIDKGPTIALEDSGRAYFGDHIEGSVEPVGFGRYKGATGAMAESLSHPLSQHIQRLNRLRAAVPALRRGQYSTEGCAGAGMAFKRRYTDADTDSFALVTVSGDATFSGIPNGTYTDAITGDTQTVSGGSLSTSGCSGQGDLRVYVLDTAKTPAPGMIDGKSQYMSGGTDALDLTWVIDRNLNGGGAQKVEPTGITVSPASASLDLGESATFTAALAPADATTRGMKWESSDPAVAKVNGGKVTAGSKEGSATITVTTGNGLTATATVTVAAKGVKVTSVALDQSSVKLDQGKSVKLTATVSPADADPKYAVLSWSSSDDSVAKVDADGQITAMKEGTATITVSTASGISATATVKVKGSGANMHKDAVYFQKPSGWGSKINAYMWEGQTSVTGEWPGTAMTELDAAQGIYGLEWPAGKGDGLNIIFNDGSNQTGDLKAQKNGFYDGSGTVIKTVDPNAADDTEEEASVIPAISASQESGNIAAVTQITYTLTNAQTASYQINGGAATAVSGSSVQVTVGEGMKNGEQVTVTVNAVSSTGDQTTKNYTYTYTGESGGQTGGNETGGGQTGGNETGGGQTGGNETGGSQTGNTGSVDISFTDANAVYPYSGQEIHPAVSVTSAGKALTEGVDYKVSYLNNVNACDRAAGGNQIPTVVVTGLGNYANEIPAGYSLTFTIEPKTLTEQNVSQITDVFVYNGQAVQPSVIVSDNGSAVREKDYELLYSNNVNAGTATVVITGKNNYRGTVVRSFTIQKAQLPAGMPEASMTASAGQMLGNVILSRGWTWLEQDRQKNVEQGMTVSATAVYEGADRDNYEILSVQVQVTGVNCQHPELARETRGAISAGCYTEGYTGDVYCTVCQTRIAQGTVLPAAGHSWGAQPVVDQAATCTEYGISSIRCQVCGEAMENSVQLIPPLGHIGGTATCCTQAVCDRCHESYGSYDSNRHIHIQLRNQVSATCQQTGYTGDSYCMDCGRTVSFGTVSPKTDHAWNAGTVTVQATADRDGVCTYTCSVCGTTKTEVIPKTGAASGQGNEPSAEQKTVTIQTEDTGSLSVGDPVRDTASKTVYRVTKASSAAKTVEYVLSNRNVSDVVVPDTVVVNGTEYKVTSVSSKAFKNNKKVEQVTVGANVRKIGSGAFTGCKNLKSVELPEGITTIENKAFYNCTDLKSVTIPAKVTKIGSKAFYGCKNLSSITIKTTKLTSKKVGSKAFKGIAAKAVFRVPASKLAAYKKLMKSKGAGAKATYKKQ